MHVHINAYVVHNVGVKSFKHSTYLNQHWYFGSILGWRRDQSEVRGDELILSWKVELIIVLQLAPLLDHLGLNLTNVVF